MKSVNAFCRRIACNNTHETNSRGNEVYRMFLPADRSLIDCADEFAAEGWENRKTPQDASYFGFWVNDRWQWTLTYAEGDWTLVRCPTFPKYLAELRDADEFYKELE